MATPAYREFQVLVRRRSYKEAADFAESQSVASGSGNVFWLTQQARALLLLGRPEKAGKIANRAVKLGPSNIYALLARAESLEKCEKNKEAYNDFYDCLKNPAVESRARYGILKCLSKTGNEWGKILSLISEWNMPENDAARWRVVALTGLKRFDEAIEACDEWLHLKPDNPQALWKLTELEIKRDGLESVRKRMGRLARIPTKPSIYVEIYASLSRRAGSNSRAVREYEKLSKKENDPKILRKQLFAMAKSGQEDKAIPLMEEFLKINPRDIYLHTSYKAACKRTSNLKRALEFYEQLHSQYPDEDTLYGRIKKLRREMESDGK